MATHSTYFPNMYPNGTVSPKNYHIANCIMGSFLDLLFSEGGDDNISMDSTPCFTKQLTLRLNDDLIKDVQIALQLGYNETDIMVETYSDLRSMILN